ncbi:MAG: hypothetical protein KGL39_16555 [Patescibacteria group bacterium]|nr:hypothetical protein [Patescibacteria group bacterium]
MKPPLKVVMETYPSLAYWTQLSIVHFNIRDEDNKLVAVTMDEELANELVRGYNKGVGE